MSRPPHYSPLSTTLPLRQGKSSLSNQLHDLSWLGQQMRKRNPLETESTGNDSMFRCLITEQIQLNVASKAPNKTKLIWLPSLRKYPFDRVNNNERTISRCFSVMKRAKCTQQKTGYNLVINEPIPHCKILTNSISTLSPQV